MAIITETVTSVGGDVKKLESSYIAGENVKSYSHFKNGLMFS